MVEDNQEWFGELSGPPARVVCTQVAPMLLPQPTHRVPEPPARLTVPSGTIPVVFYVHSRPEYFRQSIDALASAAGVDKTMIVISHDGLYPEMDAIVDRLSTRLGHQHAGVYQLVHDQCEDLDRHGHDKVLKVKAHWWWMMERVWEHLLPRSYTGPVLFLEEDHVISTDALLALQAMIRSGVSEGCHAARTTNAAAPGCFGYSLGARTKSTPTEKSSTMLRRTFGFHNTGYAFHRHVWELIQRYESLFWDGRYGWDWSMWRLMQQQKKHSRDTFPRMMLYPQVSRVYNAGVRGGVTVDDSNGDSSSSLGTWLISGIPISEGSLVVNNVEDFELQNPSNATSSIDGVDPLDVPEFVGQDHYDCARFANGGFGAVHEQLDCA